MDSLKSIASAHGVSLNRLIRAILGSKLTEWGGPDGAEAFRRDLTMTPAVVP